MNKYQSDKYYMGVASLTAKQSYAIRRKVGAIIVKDTRIISEGFNGTPSGFENKCENESYNIREDITEYITKPEVLHAESNAITKCAKFGDATDGATLYVTCSPCVECAKLIIQAGIRRVIYRDKYHDESGLKLLSKAGIEVEQFNL